MLELENEDSAIRDGSSNVSLFSNFSMYLFLVNVWNSKV